MYVKGVKEKGDQRGGGPEETGTWRLLSGFRMLIGNSLGGAGLSLDSLGFAAQTGSWKKPNELSAEADRAQWRPEPCLARSRPDLAQARGAGVGSPEAPPGKGDKSLPKGRAAGGGGAGGLGGGAGGGCAP